MPMLAGVRILIAGHPEKVQLVADVLGLSFPDRIDWQEASTADGEHEIEVTGTFVRIVTIDESLQDVTTE